MHVTRVQTFSTFASSVLACIGLASFPTCTAADAQSFVSLYAGQYSQTALNKVVRFDTDLRDSYVYVFSLGRELGSFWKDRITMELEGQAGKHTGIQDHWELNTGFTLRWHPFPWDRRIDTSFAISNGLSYTTEEPALEIEWSDHDSTSRWLYYIFAELTFALPDHPQWEPFLRAHHRSGAGGLINNAYTASNFAGLGLRYRF